MCVTVKTLCGKVINVERTTYFNLHRTAVKQKAGRLKERRVTRLSDDFSLKMLESFHHSFVSENHSNMWLRGAGFSADGQELAC